MSHIFISYSSQDRDFVQRLTRSLEPFYDIWIDRDDLEPGVKWEKHIEEGITGCTVFLVVVSPASNDSDWVARETLLAEKLRKYRIPVALEGDLPFRLLDVQYVDFRGDYDGGLRDLLEILKYHLNPRAADQEELHRLVGAGVVAHLGGDWTRANNLLAQALTLAPGALGSTVDGFWAALRAQPAAPLAMTLKDRLQIVEHTDQPVGEVYQDRRAYQWSVELDAPGDVLDRVDYADYHLHPSFDSPQQAVRDRDSNFRLTRVGWGRFILQIDVYFKDGSMAQSPYLLTFAPEHRAAFGAPVPEDALD